MCLNVRLPPDPWAESAHLCQYTTHLLCWAWSNCGYGWNVGDNSVRLIMVMCFHVFWQKLGPIWFDYVIVRHNKFLLRAFEFPQKGFSKNLSAEILSLSLRIIFFSETFAMFISSWILNSMVTELAARSARVLSFSGTSKYLSNILSMSMSIVDLYSA